MVQNWECSQSKSQWGGVFGCPGQWHTNQYHYTRVCWNHSLDIRLLSDLVGKWAVCTGLGNTFTWPIGYIIIWAQVNGVQGYDEDQIAPVVPDLSNFMAWVPMVPRTPTIGCITNVIKETEIDTLVTPWVNAHVAHIFVVWQVTTTLEDNNVTTKVLDHTEYDEVVTTKSSEMIDAFSSKILHAPTKTAFTSVKLNVMSHALCADERPFTHGLMTQNAYATVTVRNSIKYSQTLKKKIPVVAAIWVPKPQMQPGMIRHIG